VAVGRQAMYSNSIGYYNVAVGYRALYQMNLNGGNTVAVGYRALYDVTTGNQNIGIGYFGGSGLTTGNNCIYIGGGASAGGAVNECVIGQGGSTGKGNNTGYFAYAAYNSPNSTLWSVTSDERLKKNIVDNTEGLNKITQIRVRNFEYRLPDEVDQQLKPSDAINVKGVQLGVIAQELQKVLPDCVKEQSTGVLSLQADNLTWYLVNAVKELKAELDELKAKVA
jgi:hypothetical protein